MVLALDFSISAIFIQSQFWNKDRLLCDMGDWTFNWNEKYMSEILSISHKLRQQNNWNDPTCQSLLTTVPIIFSKVSYVIKPNFYKAK